MEEEELELYECSECGWTGEADEMVCRDEDLEKDVISSRFDQCPACDAVDNFTLFD